MDNKAVLDEIKTQQMTRGLNMGFHIRLSMAAVKEKSKKSFTNSDSAKLTPEVPRTTAQSRCKSPGDQTQVEELIRTAENQGVDVLPEPRGRPIFMFFPVAGINKPVLTIFDTSCSDDVVQEGIPGVEWKGCITHRGPFDMGGVGGLAAQTKDKWMVLIPRSDHKMQAVWCHSMNKVTADFPMYDVSKAVQEVKDDDPCNKLLQNIMGGEVYCLLGIKYSLLHPEALHTLPTSGLSIYPSKLKSHDGEMNAMIGRSTSLSSSSQL